MYMHYSVGDTLNSSKKQLEDGRKLYHDILKQYSKEKKLSNFYDPEKEKECVKISLDLMYDYYSVLMKYYKKNVYSK